MAVPGTQWRIACTLVALLPLASGQPTSVDAKQEREQNEDRVAHLFETLRSQASLPNLKRIRDRGDLQQLVCTAALTDAPVWHENRPAKLMYKTADPSASTEELVSIAGFKDPVDETQWTRYAVAVWPTSDRDSGKRVYWIGISIYQSALHEFIDNNFTDNRPYRKDWKKLVADPCRRVH